MPVYHAGKRPEEIDHFREALDSIVALSLSPHMIPFELIIVDDASRAPAARTIMAEYEENYPWIRTIHLDENKGPSNARNRALGIVKYDYIAGVDADDILTPSSAQFYNNAVSILGRDSYMAYINPKIKQFGTYECLAMIPQKIKDKEVALIGYAPACAVYRRDDVQDVGGWRIDAPKAEDWKLAVDVLAARWRRGLSNNIITLPHVSYLYRQYTHGENVNARPVDRLDLRAFIIKGNEDFYMDRFQTDSADKITDMISTNLNMVEHCVRYLKVLLIIPLAQRARY